MAGHESGLRALREACLKDTVEYILTFEAHNQLLQDE